jgi:hypothetical protein
MTTHKYDAFAGKRTVDGSKLSFVIFAKLPSYHELNTGSTPQVRSGIKKRYMEKFFWAIKEGVQLAKIHHLGNTSYFKEPVRISLVIHKRFQRQPDRDNHILAAGKLIVDQFFSTKTRTAAINLLPDDKDVSWGEVEFKSGHPMVEITIETIPHIMEKADKRERKP